MTAGEAPASAILLFSDFQLLLGVLHTWPEAHRYIILFTLSDRTTKHSVLGFLVKSMVLSWDWTPNPPRKKQLSQWRSGCLEPLSNSPPHPPDLFTTTLHISIVYQDTVSAAMWGIPRFHCYRIAFGYPGLTVLVSLVICCRSFLQPCTSISMAHNTATSIVSTVPLNRNRQPSHPYYHGCHTNRNK